jgi:hypothetical protein
MKQKDLPQKWQDRVQNYLVEIGSKYKEFGADNFQHDLKIKFDDGSNAFFHYAFYWIDAENKEVAVFTEHCGYHIFPLFVKLETVNHSGQIIKTEDFTIE